VPLENEIKYLENYIELEKIRLEDNLILEFLCNKQNFGSFQIAPLLLITFVENAFKHSKNTSNNEVVITVFIDATSYGDFTFRISNNYDTEFDDGLTAKKGIGLENVKKRLDAIYPKGKHHLTISQSEKQFTATLILKLG
jgi:LytS/YehU family sensor histidine kinase